MFMKNKNVLLSVKPQYANLLVDGIKTIELRKKFPEDIIKGTKLIIYSSSPEKEVIGECSIFKVEKLSIDKLWNRVATKAMISWESFSEYFANHTHGYAIQVYKPLRYKKPLKLDMLPSVKKLTRPPQSYQYIQHIN